jgi:hypothetical protein
MEVLKLKIDKSWWIGLIITRKYSASLHQLDVAVLVLT